MLTGVNEATAEDEGDDDGEHNPQEIVCGIAPVLFNHITKTYTVHPAVKRSEENREDLVDFTITTPTKFRVQY